MSLLTYRYLRESGIGKEEVVEEAFRALELCCVGDVAKQSLEVRNFVRLNVWRWWVCLWLPVCPA